MTADTKEKELPSIPPGERCNGRNEAKTKYCLLRAGWGTSHVGEGRCRKHGGKAVRKLAGQGRYAQVVVGELKQKFAEMERDGDPLDLMAELDIQRALFARELAKDDDEQDVKLLVMMAKEIISAAEKIMKLRLAEALTTAELKFMRAKMVTLLDEYIADPDRRRAFIAELTALIPGEPPALAPPSGE